MLEERGKLALARKAVLLLRLIAFASAPPGPGGVLSASVAASDPQAAGMLAVSGPVCPEGQGCGP